MTFRSVVLALTDSLLSIVLLLAAHGQESTAAPNPANPIKKLVHQSQAVVYDDISFYGKIRGLQTRFSDVYLQGGPNLGPKRIVQKGQEPQWSPSGAKIAFLGFDSHFRSYDCPRDVTCLGTATEFGGNPVRQRQVLIAHADGSGTKQITFEPNGVWDFAWSPVEDKIAYCELANDGRTAIVAVNADGSGQREITKMGAIRCLVGMPVLKNTQDDSKYLYDTSIAGGKAVVTLKSEHAGKEDVIRGNLLVTFNTISGGLLGQIIGVPTLAWSPDGEHIAFTSLAGGKPVIGVVGKDAQNLKPVVNGYAGLWSPDGKQLLFRHDSDKEPVVTSVWIANADGSDPRKILDEAAEYGVSWFPDGKGVVFGSARDSKNRGEIFRINVDGSGLSKIASQEKASLSSPVVAPNGTIVLFDATGPDPKSEYMDDFSIWMLDLATGHQQRITKGSHASVLWQKP